MLGISFLVTILTLVLSVDRKGVLGGMSQEDMDRTAKSMRNICQPKFGISDGKIKSDLGVWCNKV